MPVKIATALGAASPPLDDAQRWQAIIRRDADADGHFIYSVRTTGIYCRPSCASRLPNRTNVRFHADAAAAWAAGFRACRRCKPDAPDAGAAEREKVLRACRMIEGTEVAPDLAELAKSAGLSPHYFHRLFKKIVGVTPKDYAMAHRAKRVREKLAEGGAVTDAIYAAGFNSNGRFYAASTALLGMTPSRFRDRGANSTIRFAVGECALGTILVAATSDGVCDVLLGQDRAALAQALQRRFSRAHLIGNDPAFDALLAGVVGLVERPARDRELPPDVRGTAFRRRIWRVLQSHMANTTRSVAVTTIDRVAGRRGNGIHP